MQLLVKEDSMNHYLYQYDTLQYNIVPDAIKNFRPSSTDVFMMMYYDKKSKIITCTNCTIEYNNNNESK